ncbi:PTS sugar transporter subunit IIB [Pisciglobus halotolerans]|uniref:PTS system, cellobiose-specific IIB component n=1 Tax=Pisciglobus halotolerans TaxID=745365 RepID=A0A1I3AXI3_9LACT|nr:PTS sugar transporter subunit IIB [Pisciglobus halotolerans]SFH54795.1 PTS system, cellobiose-specific IIB component [Pisciglobus halotolerans]
MDVLMVCSGGMSSAIVVKAIKKEADKQGIDMNIKAVGSGSVEDELKDGQYDLLLVAPQVKHQFDTFASYAKENNVPIEKVEPMGYTPIGAPKTLNLIKKYK